MYCCDRGWLTSYVLLCQRMGDILGGKHFIHIIPGRNINILPIFTIKQFSQYCKLHCAPKWMLFHIKIYSYCHQDWWEIPPWLCGYKLISLLGQEKMSILSPGPTLVAGSVQWEHYKRRVCLVLKKKYISVCPLDIERQVTVNTVYIIYIYENLIQ